MAQPTDLQTQMNTVQWTNGQRLITGSFVMGLFATIFAIFSGMGTWTNGVYAPNLTPSGIASALGYTPANRAGDSFTGTVTAPNISTPTPTSSTVTDLFTANPAHFVGMSGGGAWLSFAGLPGHAPGDSERTAFEDQITSLTSPLIEETAANFGMHNTVGLAYYWIPNQAYAANAYAHNGSSLYQTASACTSGTGSGPTQSSGTSTEGTCTWAYVGSGNGDGKSAALLSTVTEAGGGNTWVAAIDNVINSGGMPFPSGFHPAVEIDQTDNDRDCPPATTGGCSIYGAILSGGGPHKGTAGILMSGAFGYYWGLAFLPGSASTYAFNDGSGAGIGINETGTHSISTYVDGATAPVAMTFLGNNPNFTISEGATSPTFMNINGSHPFADIAMHTGTTGLYIDGTRGGQGIKDIATEPVGFQFAGTYSAYQVLGIGWSVSPTGVVTSTGSKITPTTVAGLGTCNASAEGTESYVTDATTLTYGGAPAGGGQIGTTVLCSRSGAGPSYAWTMH